MTKKKAKNLLSKIESGKMTNEQLAKGFVQLMLFAKSQGIVVGFVEKGCSVWSEKVL